MGDDETTQFRLDVAKYKSTDADNLLDESNRSIKSTEGLEPERWY
jgi:hypothetical protein